MHYKLASLIANSSQKSGPISEVYIAQPDAEKERLGGKLFVLIEAQGGKTNSLKLINFIINSINQNYYQNDKIILREKISSLKIEHIFETALAKTNRDIKEFLKEEKIKIKTSDLNVTVGVIYENNLHFSNVGKNKAMLIYKEKEERKNKKAKQEENQIIYKIAILGKDEGKKPKTKETDSIFAEVISGAIPQDGYFLFTNEALPEYLSNKQLIDIITKLPPLGAAEQIKNTLSSINAYISFSGVIIKNSVGDPEPKTAPKESNIISVETANSSLENLNTTEENTEKYLSSTGIINLKKWSNNIKNKISKNDKTNSQKSNPFALKDKIFVKKKNPLLYFKNIFNFIKDIMFYIGRFFFWILKLKKNKEKTDLAEQKTKEKPKKNQKTNQNITDWFLALNKKRKTLLTIGVICLLLFTISVSITVINKKQVEKQRIITEKIETIKKKQNQIEANLLYNNEKGAKELLKENDNLLADLLAYTEEKTEQYNEFIKKHNEQKEKVRHIVYLDPKEIADFNNLNSQANANNIIYYEDKIYAGDGEQSSIYITNLNDNSTTAVTDINLNINSLKYPVASKNGMIYFMDNDEIIGLNAETEDMENISISLPDEKSDIVSMEGYNNHIYALDYKNNEIYKYTKTNKGFTKRDNWIVDKNDFSTARDLSIDGNIYILLANGNILKYYTGKQREFKMDLIDPEITDASKMFVFQNDDGYIYILEPSTSRLIVFDKEGRFIKQYKLNNLDNIKDFTIDENANIAYFLNGNKVYEAKLE